MSRPGSNRSQNPIPGNGFPTNLAGQTGAPTYQYVAGPVSGIRPRRGPVRGTTRASTIPQPSDTYDPGATTGGSTSTSATPSEGLLTKPGVGETYGAGLVDKYSKPSPYADWIAELMGKARGQTPRAQGQYYSNQSYYNQPVPYTDDTMHNIQLLENPTNSQEAYDLAQPELTKPSDIENYAGRRLWEYDNPWAAETQWGQIVDQYNKPGEYETKWEGLYNKLDEPSDLQKRAGAIDTDLSKIANAEDAYTSGAPALKAKGYAERLADQWDPSKLTYSEQFLTGKGVPGLDATFDRLKEKGRRDLENRAAASGSFNSGAALAAEGELTKDLDSDYVGKLMEMSNQADVNSMARAAEGRGLATNADTGLRSRYATLSQAGREADISAEARATGRRELGESLSQEQRLRLQEQAKLAADAQKYRFDRLEGSMRGAAVADSTRGARLEGGRALSTASDTGRINRFDALGRLGSVADAETRQRAVDKAKLFDELRQRQAEWKDKAADSALKGDNAGKASIGDDLGLIKLAEGIDQGRDEFGNTVATGTQKLFEGRERGNFDDITRFTDGLATRLSSLSEGERVTEVNLALEGINAVLANGNATAEQKQQAAATYRAILSTAMNAGVNLAMIKGIRGMGASPNDVGAP